MTSPADGARSGRAATLWTFLWGAFAVFQVTQAIWLSGGAAAPGGMSDGRFNHCVLEHGWLALRGDFPLADPAQFFPETGTLASSDTHLGTLPLYAAARALGLPPDRAWQTWFVVLAALNAFAAARVLRALAVPVAWRGPALFAAVAAPAMVWSVGHHAQVLPLAPAWFALEQLLRWRLDRAPRRLALAAAWFAWQFAAAPYLAFFAAVYSAGGAATALGAHLLSRRRDPSPTSAVAASASAPGDVPAATAARRAWWRAAPILVAGPALAALVATLYLDAADRMFAKPTVQLDTLAPTLTSWFTASPCHLLGEPAPPVGPIDPVEHSWFSGALAWLGLPFALIVGWRTRAHGGLAAVLLAAGATGGFLFFTRWSPEWPGAWLRAAEHFPALRGFRAAGRAALVLHPLQVAALVAALAAFVAAAPTRGRRIFATTMLALLAVESLAWRQPALRFADVAARETPLVAAWREAGDRPVLAYAPGYTNQPVDFLHLDAWGASLRLRRATLNGYSGTVPDSHQLFFLNPTPERARELCARRGVDPERVSFVTALPPAAEQAIGLVRFPGRPVSALEGFGLPALAWRMDVAPVRFEMDGRVLHQFTPPTEALFALPDDAQAVEFVVAMRDGSWNGPGRTDGAEYRWAVRDAAGRETELLREVLNPRDEPAHRGVLARSLALPPGTHRTLVLRTTSEPSGDNWWDWPLVGELHAR